MNRRFLSIAMCAALAAAPVQAWAGETEAAAGTKAKAENGTFSFDQLSDLVFYFSSGAGGWFDELLINPDGSFTGNYHDSEMGNMGDDYPNGTVYESSYHGTLTVDGENGENSWKLKVESLETDGTDGEERIEDEIRYVTCEPAGFKEGDTLTLFAPGYSVADLPEGYLFWAHLNVYNPQPEELPVYGIYNEEQETGFVASERYNPDETEAEGAAASGETETMAGMANPWVETDAKGFSEKMGIDLNVPEGAENVSYYIMDGKLGEMNFTWKGADCCARCKASGSWEDISGLYYDKWDKEEACKVKHCEGKTRSVMDQGRNLQIRNCMWIDMVPGIMYSLTAEAKDLNGFDELALAEAVYVQMQGDS